MKYRGFCKDTNEWVHGYYSRIQGKYLIIKPSGEQCEIDPKSIGIKSTKQDAYGANIFEGDIIELENSKGIRIQVEVKFGNAERLMSSGVRCNIEGFYYETSDGFKSFPIMDNYKGCTDYELFEIVGNSYDSPDFRVLSSY